MFQQIERQTAESWRINREIADVLKVFYFETGQAVRSFSHKEKVLKLRPNRPLVFHEIRQFFAILGGSDLESVQSHWIPEKIESNRYVSDQLIQATIYGLLTLAKRREPILKIAERVARVILPLETLLEKLITGEELSEIDHARKDMPDPWIVANNFQKKAKNVVYNIETVALAMTETREYILKNDLRTLNRHVEAIKRIVSNKIPVNPDSKTIRNWIKIYGNSVFSGKM